MKQSRAMSLVESLINIAVGFGLSLLCQAAFLPLLGVDLPFSANFAFALIMTAVSIVRQFCLRRIFEALHIRRPLSPFMLAVIAERFRQIEIEGWSIDHDDSHETGEMGKAGANYLYYAGEDANVPSTWPWDRRWWKPQNFRRDLVRGAALAIAEGEKFDRRKTSSNKIRRAA